MKSMIMILLFCFAAGAMGIWLQRPPAPDAPASIGFSMENAERHLAVIAKEPHPSGSEANVTVRRYIKKTLEDLGLDVVEQSSEIEFTSKHWHGESGVEVTNVAARLRGKGDGRAIVIAAHFDSRFVIGDRPGVPGAGDDGAAVAAILESARLLVAEGPRRNDVILLLTDGEEFGLLGASAFVGQPHPWWKDVRYVFNFEGRGNAGAGLMFQTGPQNAELIRHFARASPYPIGASLMNAIYKKMPNDTDFTVFLNNGASGLNFAWVGGYENYHQPTDTIENLDRRSFAHHAINILALARHFGDVDLDTLGSDGDATYFNLTSSVMVRYGNAWVLPLALLAAVLAIAFVVHSLRRGAFGLGRLFGATGAHLLVIGAATSIAFGIAMIGLKLDRARGGFPMGLSHHDEVWFALMTIATAAVATWRGTKTVRRDGASLLLSAWMIPMALLSLAAAILLPDAGFLLTWPLLIVVAAALLGTKKTGPSRVATLIATTLVLAFLAPFVLLVYQGMMLGLAAAAAPLVVLAVTPAAALVSKQDDMGDAEMRA